MTPRHRRDSLRSATPLLAFETEITVAPLCGGRGETFRGLRTLSNRSVDPHSRIPPDLKLRGRAVVQACERRPRGVLCRLPRVEACRGGERRRRRRDVCPAAVRESAAGQHGCSGGREGTRPQAPGRSAAPQDSSSGTWSSAPPTSLGRDVRRWPVNPAPRLRQCLVGRAASCVKHLCGERAPTRFRGG